MMLSRFYSFVSRKIDKKIIPLLQLQPLQIKIFNFSHNYPHRGYHTTMSSVINEFTLPNDQPVTPLSCEVAFNGLTKKEKLYAHYLSQASWVGSLIVLFQTSPESPVIFTLLHKIYSEESIEELKEKALTALSEEELKAIFVYSCGFFDNMGNYKGFGDTKFIPNLPVEKFEVFVKGSKAYEKASTEIDDLWVQCKSAMYSLADNVKSLGFPGKGVTTYFSSNYSSADVECVTNLMLKNKIEGWNNRTIKIESPTKDGLPRYQVLLASVEEGIEKSETYEELKAIFEIKKGDYSPLLNEVNRNLLEAKKYVSTKDEELMIDRYVKSFETGSVEEHKNGSRYWIKNKNPIIETYIGFIENYRDPQGSRAEFEGFVAMVNKEMSKKFSILVDRAEEIIPELPWPPAFEKDKFQRPDFTALDVLTFGGSGIPAGINIPNYDEIRQNDGFKNVYLSNVLTSRFKKGSFSFLSPEDEELLLKYVVPSFKVQVGLHELLGHGSGKLFHRFEDGSFDFDPKTVLDPLTKQPISSWYEPGENYDSVFASLGSTYEECRAECVGLYLSLIPEVVKIFIDNEADIENITYVNWLLMMLSGIEKALEMYQPTTGAWLQAHCHARFVIARVLLEAGDDLITVTETIPDEKLLITLNRDKIHTTGAEAIRNFLLKLQVYKSTANKAEAQKLYDKYSDVSDSGNYPWKRWRSIILKHKKPRQMFVQPNTSVEGDDVQLKMYESTPEGVIKSWVERLSNKEVIYESLMKQAMRDREHFIY